MLFTRWRWVACLGLVAALASSGCNIFSWTHDEGSSDDPEVLMMDAEDALLGRDYGEALRIAEKGIAGDPGLEVPRLRWIASRAVLAQSEISIATYLNAFTDKPGVQVGGASRALADGSRLVLPVIATPILTLTEEELRRLGESCPRAAAFLGELVEASARGDLDPRTLEGYWFDVNVGYGVTTLLTAFVTVLDDTHRLDDGFQLNSLVTIQAVDNGYVLEYNGPDPATYARDVLFCPLRCLFVDALEGMYDAYRDAAGVAEPHDLSWNADGTPVSLEPLNIDTQLLIGQALQFTHEGVRYLFQRYGCPCTERGEAQ